MAVKKDVIIKTRHCEFIHLDVELKERRMYPSADFLRAEGNEYRVEACSCSAAISCNMAGIPCRWAMNSPASDRF